MHNDISAFVHFDCHYKWLNQNVYTCLGVSHHKFFFCWCSGMNELIGIFVGHLYFFLVFKYPQDYGGPKLINTPQFL